MRWDEIRGMPCSVARTLSVIGDRWTLLVLRDAFLRTRRFEDFQRSLRITRHLLAGRLRKLEPHRIRYVYFAVLTAFALFGLVMLSIGKPKQLVDYAGLILNFALGFSCWHTLGVNLILLPRELRPGWFARCGLLLAGLFFNVMATVATLQAFGRLG